MKHVAAEHLISQYLREQDDDDDDDKNGKSKMEKKLEQLAKKYNGESKKFEADDDDDPDLGGSMTTKHESADDAKDFVKAAEQACKKEYEQVDANSKGKNGYVEWRKKK